MKKVMKVMVGLAIFALGMSGMAQSEDSVEKAKVKSGSFGAELNQAVKGVKKETSKVGGRLIVPPKPSQLVEGCELRTMIPINTPQMFVQSYNNNLSLNCMRKKFPGLRTLMVRPVVGPRHRKVVAAIGQFTEEEVYAINGIYGKFWITALRRSNDGEVGFASFVPTSITVAMDGGPMVVKGMLTRGVSATVRSRDGRVSVLVQPVGAEPAKGRGINRREARELAYALSNHVKNNPEDPDRDLYEWFIGELRFRLGNREPVLF